ncbi:MAG: hypothetical protein PHX87_04125 [Candidatus Peribacteraceae bacterium]|nr:hypothetical protein [Candidatus Peribacteraceae bacterium]MDD5742589.1 hypothetical protein [Candidatus Peribacteraceae bacterium]
MTPDVSEHMATPTDHESDIPRGKKPKDTVHNRKGFSKAATQRFLPIAEIRNDTVVLKNGGLRAVLAVEALNFNLKSETEQKGIIAGYQSFVNTIDFPLQIVIRSTKINIDPYIQQLRVRANEQPNELLRDQTVEYANFIERIVEAADIMQKRFYVVVPLDDHPKRKSMIATFLEWIGIDDSTSKALARHQMFEKRVSPLRDRINLVEAGLNSIGLTTRRLTTRELLELYYQVYNPGTSQEQKLNQISDINTSELVL